MSDDCARCRVTAKEPLTAGILHLAAPTDEIAQTLAERLALAGAEIRAIHPEIISLVIEEGAAERIVQILQSEMGPAELDESRALLLGVDEVPTLRDLMRTQPLRTFLGMVEGQWLNALLSDKRIFSHFQPIVSSASPAEVFGYECLLRGRGANDEMVSPGRMYEVAKAAQMSHQLDREARLAAIGGAIKHGLDTSYLFINFLPTSIYDPHFCLRSTIAAIQESRFEPGRVVFEVVESAQVEDVKHLNRILDVYREAGFKVALDDLGAGYGSLNLLHQLRPDFVKLDRELIRDVPGDSYKGEVAARLLDLALALGVKTIAEGVETVDEWRWARDHGAHYVQGYLFAKPGLPPPVPAAPREDAALA